MKRITEHSKTTFFKDSDVIVNGQRLGPAAFESEVFYKHYVDIINRLAELEDRYCNTPQTHADQLRAMTDEDLAEFVNDLFYGLHDNPGMCDVCDMNSVQNCKQCWLAWLREESEG